MLRDYVSRNQIVYSPWRVIGERVWGMTKVWLKMVEDLDILIIKIFTKRVTYERL